MKPKRNQSQKKIVIIAGPNGAGKTTFAEQYLLQVPDISSFINADLIARGLSPLAPASVALEAGSIMLEQIRSKVSKNESFAFETTLSGRSYAQYIRRWRVTGYSVTLIFLSLPSAEAALARVRLRVAQGGHSIPEAVIRRRFEAGIRNFGGLYRELVNSWAFYDNSGPMPVLIDSGDNE